MIATIQWPNVRIFEWPLWWEPFLRANPCRVEDMDGRDLLQDVDLPLILFGKSVPSRWNASRRSQNEFRQVGIAGEVTDVLFDESFIDFYRFARPVGSR